MDKPFGNLEPAPGRALVSIAGANRASVWRIAGVTPTGGLSLECPFGSASPRTITTVTSAEYVAPNVETAVAYLRLVGKEFV